MVAVTFSRDGGAEKGAGTEMEQAPPWVGRGSVWLAGAWLVVWACVCECSCHDSLGNGDAAVWGSILTRGPCGDSFPFPLPTSVAAAYKHADGKKIDGRRVLVDVERGRTVKGWRPRRLGERSCVLSAWVLCPVASMSLSSTTLLPSVCPSRLPLFLTHLLTSLGFSG